MASGPCLMHRVGHSLLLPIYAVAALLHLLQMLTVADVRAQASRQWDFMLDQRQSNDTMVSLVNNAGITGLLTAMNQVLVLQNRSKSCVCIRVGMCAAERLGARLLDFRPS